jgi:hypothetical protein
MKHTHPLKAGLLSFLVIAGFLNGTSLHAQSQITFDHLNAGAVGTAYGDQLIWSNGAVFSTNAGYYKMVLSTSGTYAGYYNSSPTMTVLAATTNHSGPVPGAPALGSFIQVQITLISAPVGGAFDFWNVGALSPSYILNVGDSSSLVAISGGTDNPDAGTFGVDPYGHIHGRRFGATALGDYIVGLQLFDTSDNGLDGLPIHTPSDMFYMNFRAVATVPEPATVTLMGLALLGTGLKRLNRR